MQFMCDIKIRNVMWGFTLICIYKLFRHFCAVTAGKPNVRTVQPFTSVDLKQIPLPEILRNFQIMEAENAPVYPLQFLYPNIPKDQAFGKYYSEKTGGKQLSDFM